jgi:hypothetical protein
MNQMPKQLETNPRVIKLYDCTIAQLYLRALKGLRQPFKVEFSDEDDQIFFMTGIRLNGGGEPSWDRNYPRHRRGLVTVSLREHTRLARTIDIRQTEESEKSCPASCTKSLIS